MTKDDDGIFNAIKDTRKFYQQLCEKYPPMTAFKAMCAAMGASCHASSDPSIAFDTCKKLITVAIEFEKELEIKNGKI